MQLAAALVFTFIRCSYIKLAELMLSILCSSQNLFLTSTPYFLHPELLVRSLLHL